MEDYIILVDETGRPYIAHADMLGGARRGAQRLHKYIMKIGDGAKARYFYTQEEIRAYQRERALNNAVKGMQKDAEKVVKKAEKVTNKTEQQPANRLQDKIKAGVDNVKSTTERMKDEFRKKADEKAEKKSAVSGSADALEKPKMTINGSYSKTDNPKAEATSAKEAKADTSSEEAAISEIRKIASNSDKSLSAAQRKELGAKYGLDEKTLNIIDGNLRSPDMKGPRGQKWIDDYIRKKATLNGSSDEQAKSSGTSAESEKSSGSKSEFDASIARFDTVMNAASKRGIDVKKLDSANASYSQARTKFNKLRESGTASAQQISAAQRAMKRAKDAYTKELEQIVEELNK